MRINAYSHDHELLQALRKCCLPHDALVAHEESPFGLADSPCRHALAVVAFSPNTPSADDGQETSLQAKLYFISSPEDICADTCADHASDFGFLVWPTAPCILRGRLALIRNHFEEQSSARHANAERSWSERRFWSATRWLPSMVALTAPSGNALYFNEAFRNFIGAGLGDEVYNQSWLSWLDPDDLDRVMAAFPACISKRETLHAGFRLKRHDGAWRHVTMIAAPIFDEDGRFAGTVALVEDVHDQVISEIQARENERMFLDLAESLPLLIWQTRPNGEVIFQNQRFKDFVGTPPHDGTIWDHIIHQEDAPAIRALWTESVRTGTPFICDLRLLHGPTKVYRWQRVALAPVRDKHGTVLRWTGSAMDIDLDRRRADELKHLYQQLDKSSRAKADFLAALSHELRTPLNVVMGYATLQAEILDFDPQTTMTLESIRNNAQEILARVEELPWPSGDASSVAERKA